MTWRKMLGIVHRKDNLVFKAVIKKIVPPSTSMMDARIAKLERENDELRREIFGLRSEISKHLSYIHADICSDKLLAVKKNTPIKPFILSVATYAPRFSSISKVFRALYEQEVYPCETHVWIPRKDAPDGLASLPHEMLSAFLEWGGVSVHWVDDDLGPHNKYFWIMRDCPACPVVTIDDDAILPKTLFKTLWDTHERFPNCVVATRTHRMTCCERGGAFGISPYRDWYQEQDGCVLRPSFDLLPTGLGGVLYPAGIMPKHCFDADAIKRTCQFGDDLWLKIMELSVGVQVVDCGCGFVQELVDGSQECALFHENQEQERNDVYLDNIFRYLDGRQDIDVTSAEVIQRIMSAGREGE